MASRSSTARQPWRYACRECGSVSVYRLEGGRYHCNGCRTNHDGKPRDKKKE